MVEKLSLEADFVGAHAGRKREPEVGAREPARQQPELEQRLAEAARPDPRVPLTNRLDETAERNLAAALRRLRAEGLEADGTVGDPDPIVAVRDIWDPARFDEVIVSTLPAPVSKWLKLDLPRRVRRLTGVEVTHIMASEAPAWELRR